MSWYIPHTDHVNTGYLPIPLRYFLSSVEDYQGLRENTTLVEFRDYYNGSNFEFLSITGIRIHKQMYKYILL